MNRGKARHLILKELEHLRETEPWDGYSTTDAAFDRALRRLDAICTLHTGQRITLDKGDFLNAWDAYRAADRIQRGFTDATGDEALDELDRCDDVLWDNLRKLTGWANVGKVAA